MTHATCKTSNEWVRTFFAGLLTLAALPVSNSYAQDNPFDEFPVLIQCKYKQTYHAFYMSRVSEDGVATYVASERMGGTITLDGKAKATGGTGGSCVGKTLSELRASGQAFDLKR